MTSSLSLLTPHAAPELHRREYSRTPETAHLH